MGWNVFRPIFCLQFAAFQTDNSDLNASRIPQNSIRLNSPLFFTFVKCFELTKRLYKTTYCGVLFMRPLDVVPPTQSSTSDLI